ncbi:MFS transporter [Thermosipho atlanticus]|uniref:Predicted arabinose efflux permease, MFS family n=1 Tax=Thermosipho atlanticus DSM 15807 TaxID=1123380 RepID=A0A1M5QXS6_9BACT|nr:MFS transporter [Thermosipho atlanticus]SHH18509.1 Predicted arabinose efflux permease, MFS family [Thermosipho atlanticus DSM 15807]
MSAPVKIILFTFFNGISRNIYQVLFNLYLKSLGYDNEIIGTIMSYNLWGGALLALLIGYFSDKVGRKKVLFLIQPFIVVFAIMRLFPLSANYLYISSFLYGGLNASTRILSDVFIVENTHNKNRAKFFGLNFGANMLTGVLGNATGGILGDLFGFKNVMISAMILRLFAIVPMLNLEEKRIKKGKFLLNDFQKKVFSFYIFSTASVGFGAGLFIHFGNVIFYDLFSLSATLIGFILAFAQLGTSIGSAFSHKLGKKFGAGRLLLISHFIVPILIFMLAIVREPIIFTTIYVSRFTIMNMVNPIFNTLVLSFLPSNILASSAGIRNFANNGMRAIAAMVFANLATGNEGYFYIFIISAAFYFINAVVTFIFYKNLKGKDKEFYEH